MMPEKNSACAFSIYVNKDRNEPLGFCGAGRYVDMDRPNEVGSYDTCSKCPGRYRIAKF